MTIADGRHGMPDKLPGQFYTTFDSFELESGEVLVDATVAFTIRGRLNASRTNVIVICHALSGSADCFDWWSLLLSRPAKPAVDTSKYFVICFNALGSPYGSSSPLCSRPGSASLYGNVFPKTTIRDDARYVFCRIFVTMPMSSLFSPFPSFVFAHALHREANFQAGSRRKS
jgi:homoserine acetyltransferase